MDHPFFYRLGNRLRRCDMTCPGAHSCQVARQRLKSNASDYKVYTHMSWLRFEMNLEGGKELVR